MARTTRATVLWSSSRGSGTDASIPEGPPGMSPAARHFMRARWARGSAALDERAQALAARGVPELPQRLGLDLPDALAGHLEILAHLFQRVVRLLPDAEPHPEDLLLARRERGEHL